MALLLWRDIAWQVGYEPLDLTDSEFEPPTIRFDRSQHDTELHRLLLLESRDWRAPLVRRPR